MKYKITDAAVKRLIEMFGENLNRFVDPMPTIRQWAVNENLYGDFINNLRDLLAHNTMRENHPHLIFQISYHLTWELEQAQNKLKAIKQGFKAINEID